MCHDVQHIGMVLHPGTASHVLPSSHEGLQ